MADSGNDDKGKQIINDNVHEGTGVYEDEINLRDYIQVVIKRRKLIISIFLVVVVAVIYSLFLPKVYQASATIMLMPSTIRTAVSPSRNLLDPETTKIGGYIESKLSISIPTHRSLLKSNAVLERVMGKLRLAGKVDDELTIVVLSNKLRVEDTKKTEEETNILQLTSKDKDPVFSKDIVNLWAKEYAEYSLDIITGEVKGSGDFIESQFQLVTDELVKAEQAVEDFDVKERLSFMEIELKENISQLNTHYAKVHKLDFALQEKKNQLLKLDSDIAAMTKDGMWLGAFSVKELGQKYFADEALSDEQNALRQKALKAKLDHENGRKKRDAFVNDSKIMLLRAEVECKRANLINDKA